jgi:hypothetical protein
MANGQTTASVTSATASLKALVTIISGLAASTAVVRLLANTAVGNDYGAKLPPLDNVVLFAVAIATILRFYHGNTRHLDEEYSGRFGKASNRASGKRAPVRVAADFLVVFIESIILSILSYLSAGLASRFFSCLAALLLLDAIWFFFAHRNKTDTSQSISWAANNLFFGILILSAVIWKSGGRLAPEYLNYWTLGVSALALINVTIDVGQEFQFYFPNPNPGIHRVFVAAPFTDVLGEQTLIPVGEFRRELAAFVAALRTVRDEKDKRRYYVFLSHEREKWGEGLYKPEQALAEDLEELDQTDVVVALLTDTPSPGVQLEIGYALARNIPVIQIRHGFDGNNVVVPYLNEAFDRPQIRDELQIYVVKDTKPSHWVQQVHGIISTLDDPGVGREVRPSKRKAQI